MKSIGSYPLEVNYDLPIRELLRVANVEYVHPEINLNSFQARQGGIHKLKLEILHFDKVMGYREAEEEINQNGMQPATIEEVLALSRVHPEAPQHYDIVALGSVGTIVGSSSSKYAPYLTTGGRSRSAPFLVTGLILHRYCLDFGGDMHLDFAAIREAE